MNNLNFKYRTLLNPGFTLLEILLVVGIIAILAGIVIVAINPGRQLAMARNTERRSDLKQINNALQQYYIDHREYPGNLSDALTDICDTGDMATSSVPSGYCNGRINLSVLVPTYITAIPKDPQATTTASAGYQVIRHSSGGRIGLLAPGELDQIITINIPVEEVYTVTFNTAGGSTTPSPITDIVSGDTITLPTDPTKDGYTFDGWYTEINGGGIEFTESTAVVADITIYAKWVTADPCGVSGDATDPDCWSSDMGQMAWTSTMQTTNASSTTNGFINTQLIKNSFTIGNYPAFNTCYNYNDGVHPVGTWYLPAQQQLISAVQGGVGGWYSGVRYYWSSTEDTYGNPGSNAILIRSSDANVYPDRKTYSTAYRVRCLR